MTVGQKKKARWRRKTTLTGRVVYDRKPHLYNENDFKRIFRAIFKRTASVDSAIFYISTLYNLIVEMIGDKEEELLKLIWRWLQVKLWEKGKVILDEIIAWAVGLYEKAKPKEKGNGDGKD